MSVIKNVDGARVQVEQEQDKKLFGGARVQSEQGQDCIWTCHTKRGKAQQAYAKARTQARTSQL